MQNKMLKNKKVAFVWAFSYIVVLLIPTILSVVTYLNNCKVISDDLRSQVNQTVRHDTNLLEEKLDHIVNAAIQISLNSNFRKTAGYAFPLNENDKFEVRSLISDVSGYTVSQTYISQITFYYPSADTMLVNGVEQSPEFQYEAYDLGKKEYFKKWYDKLTSSDSNGFFSIYTGNKKIMYFKYATRIASAYGESPIILIEISDDFLKSLENDSYELFIVDEDGGVLSSSKDGNVIDDNIKMIMDSDNGGGDIGKNYMICWQRLSNIPWKYVCVLDKSFWFKPLENTIRNVLLTTIAGLIIGVFFIRYFIKQNKMPIEEILKKMKTHDLGKTPEVNELKYIESVVDDTIKQNGEYENAIFHQKKYLIDNIFNKIAHGMAADSEIKILESMGIVFKHEKFLVISFYIENFGNIYFEDGEETAEKLKHAQLILTNITEELLNKEFASYFFNSDALPVCIVNLQCATDKEKNRLKEIMVEVNDYIQSKFNFGFVAGFSNVHETIKGLNVSYEESIEAIEQRFICQEQIIDYSEIDTIKPGEYYYPIEKEEIMIKCAEAGDFEACKEQLDYIFEINFDKYHLSLTYARFLMIDIMSTFIKSIKQCRITQEIEFVQSEDIINKINKCDNIREAKQFIYDVFQSFCQYTKTHILDTSNELVVSIKSFVNEYYNDEQLSVAMISDNFKVHPNYISKVFKKETEQGLLEYISKVRIEKAKELIIGTDDTFEVISKKVGISTVRTFFRLFSKFEGITPGKYREINQK